MYLRAKKNGELAIMIGLVLVAALSGYLITGQFAVALAMILGMLPVIMSIATRH